MCRLLALMLALMLALVGPSLTGFAAAGACGVPVGQPAEVHLPGDGAAPSALLIVPALWHPGDPAAVLAGDAFRSGCEDARTASLVEAGVAVLALGGNAEEGRLAAALVLLRQTYAAGGVALLWLEPAVVGHGLCEAVLTGHAPEGACATTRRRPR